MSRGLLPDVFSSSRWDERVVFFYITGQGDGHVQSLVIGASFLGIGAISLMAGLLADLIAANRSISADIRARLLTAELQASATFRLTI